MPTNIITPFVDRNVAFDNDKADYRAAPRDLKFDENCRLIVPDVHSQQLFGTGVAPLKMSEYAYSQLFARMGTTVYGRGSQRSLPGEYLLGIPDNIRAEALNWHLQEKRINQTNGKYLVRAYKNEARAVLSNNYVVIDNKILLEGLESAVDYLNTKGNGGDWRIVRAYHDENSVLIRLLRRDTGPNGNYGIGAMVRDSEVGRSNVEVLPFIQRHSCENSTVIDDEAAFTSQHRGDQGYIRDRLVSALQQAFKLSLEWFNKYMAAETEFIDDFDDVLKGMAVKYNWSDDVKMKVALGTENSQTRAGLVNGITYAAHTALEDPEAQLAMEKLGGAILAGPDSLFTQAKKLAYLKNVEGQMHQEAHGQQVLFA